MQPKFFCVFLLFVLASTQDVTVYPEGTFVSYRGGEAEFSCYSLPLHIGQVTQIQWLVNGSLLESFDFDNAVTEFDDSIANGIGTLEFSNLTQNFNMTRIQCIAHYQSRPSSTSTEATILLLQGIPQAVTSLSFIVSDSTLHLTWMAPHSLDVTDVHPDVTYHVDVINSITLAKLESARGVNVTQFNYTIPQRSSCYIIMVIVTSVNVANMTGGRSTVSYIEAGTRPQFVSAVRMSAVGSVFTYLLTMTDPVCDIDLTFTDMDALERVEMDNDDVMIVGTNVTFSTERLRVNRRYTVLIGASNIHGTAPPFPTQLSTHGVQDAVIALTETGEIKANVSFSEISSEVGAMIVFINEADISKSVILTLDRSIADNYTLPVNLYPGQHMVFVYDIERDGTLRNGVGYPAFDGTLPTRANSQGFSLQPNIGLNCDVTNDLRRIDVECTYGGDPSITGFQVIAQLSNSSEVSKLFTAKATSRQTLANVMVEENGLYLVTVLAITEGMGIVNSGVVLPRQLVVSNVPPPVTTAEVDSTVSTAKDAPTTDDIMEGKGGLSDGVIAAVVVAIFVLVVAVVIITIIIWRRRVWKKCNKYTIPRDQNSAVPPESGNRRSPQGSEYVLVKQTSASTTGDKELVGSQNVSEVDSPATEADDETKHLLKKSTQKQTIPRRCLNTQMGEAEGGISQDNDVFLGPEGADGARVGTGELDQNSSNEIVVPVEVEARSENERVNSEQIADTSAASQALTQDDRRGSLSPERAAELAPTTNNPTAETNSPDRPSEQVQPKENDVPAIILPDRPPELAQAATSGGSTPEVKSPTGPPEHIPNDTPTTESSSMSANTQITIPNRSHNVPLSTSSATDHTSDGSSPSSSNGISEQQEEASDELTQAKPIEATDINVASSVISPPVLSTFSYQSDHQTKILADEQLRDIADEMPPFMSVLPHLELSHDDLNRIKANYQDEQQQMLEALMIWKREQGIHATIGNLFKILNKITKHDGGATETTVEASEVSDKVEEDAVLYGLNMFGRRKSSTQRELFNTTNVSSNVIPENIQGMSRLHPPRIALLRSQSEPGYQDQSPERDHQQQFPTQVSQTADNGDVLESSIEDRSGVVDQTSGTVSNQEESPSC